MTTPNPTIDHLRELGELLMSGTITEEEFQQLKAALLKDGGDNQAK